MSGNGLFGNKFFEWRRFPDATFCCQRCDFESKMKHLETPSPDSSNRQHPDPRKENNASRRGGNSRAFQTAWYRYAVLLTGRPALALDILKEVAGHAAHEMDQLRTPQARNAWLARTIQEKCFKALNAGEAPAEVPTEPWLEKVLALSPKERMVFALFHCLPGEIDPVAELLGVRNEFADLLAQARKALAPEQQFATDPKLVVHRPWGGDTSKVAKAVRKVSDRDSLPLGAQATFDRRWHDRILSINLPVGVNLPDFEGDEPFILMATLRHPAVLAIAFAFLVVLGVLFLGVRKELDEFPGRELLVALVEGNGEGEWEKVSGTKAGELEDWFMLKGFDGFTVPQELEDRPVTACRVVTVEGQPVAQLDLEGGRLFVLRGNDLGVRPDASEWRFFLHSNDVVGVREAGQNCYVVVVAGEQPELKQFLQGAAK